MNQLEKGATLIEASAGTGKTYRLCRIALQLTVEKGITLDRILAVTFTEAATEELAARIHELYQKCLHELDTGDIREELLVKLAENGQFDPDRAKRALRYSLEVFDEAPISTIHGFCKRSLELIALETKAPLDAELVPVEDSLIENLQAEYIRERILESSTALSLALPSQTEFVQLLGEIGRQTATHPRARLHPQPLPVSVEQLDRRVSELPGKIAKLLAEKNDYLPGIRKNSRIAKQLSDPAGVFARIANRGSLLPDELRLLSSFDEEAWKSALTKKGADLGLPDAISQISVINQQLHEAFAQLIFQYRDCLRGKIEDAKQRMNIITFNDLLHLLRRALASDNDESLAKLISAQYDAALIDEFQDTDGVQLEIAQTLFGQGEHYLFYIGDPKQSIYRFRGADIYAYFGATEGSVQNKVTLDTNYRSAAPLVAAVNHIFEKARAGFADARIRFEPVKPDKENKALGYGSAVPFAIEQFVLEDADPKRAPGKADYVQTMAERAANDLARRLNENPNLPAGDVTFLVNNHREADALNQALLQRGIVSAVRADRSIFKTEEAEDLRQLLASLASPSRNSLKRGAYACLDRSLRASTMAEEAFEINAAPFFEYISEWARNWETANFDVHFRRLIALLPRQSATAADLDAERRLANLHHLSELLSEEQSSEELSPLGLLNWLNRQKNADTSKLDDWQTRLTSETGKPQILTVHKSKGLQFPIVILPFVGLRRIRKKERITTYHGPDDELVIDMAPEADSPAFEHARRENLAEDIRLLYVALTRAECENWLYLCPEEISSRSDFVCSSFAQFILNEGDASTTEQLGEALRSIADSSNGVISFRQSAFERGAFISCEAKPETSASPVEARPLANRAHLPGPERVLSFSAISKFAHFALEEEAIAVADAMSVDDEPSEAEELTPDEAETDDDGTYSIFTLPKGTQAGDLIHLILERYDFSRPDTLAETTRRAFEEVNFKPSAYEVIVAGQISTITETRLPCPFGSFRLCDVPAKRRIAELEFSYPVSGDTLRGIAAALKLGPLGNIPRNWAERFSRLTQSLDGSMLRGYIDLILEHEGRLYILDWKSNYLGSSLGDYTREAMSEAMAEHDYYLQYLLYCVALKRYLAWRSPRDAFEDRFGGVYYLFARGMAREKETGIFYDRPSVELLETLDQALGASQVNQ